MERDLDLFLFIPCDLTYFNENNITKTTSTNGTFLLDQIEMNNNEDFNNNFIKSLKRLELGEFKLTFKDLDTSETAIAYFTVHPKTHLGILCFYISKIKNKANEILGSFIGKKFSVNDISVADWSKSINVKLLGTPRCLAFSYTELEEKEKVSILACDSAEDRLKGKEFIDASHHDIAQYNSADVFCSENVLLEMQHEFVEDIKERIEIEAWEIFFMELLLLQDASISRICDKIIAEFNKEETNPLNASDTDILDSLSSELSESILFLDFNHFIFPTTRISVEKISRNFRIDRLIDKYNTYKDLLESLITIRKNKIEDLETGNMNVLLLILTLTQVLPVISSLFEMIINKNITFSTIVSFISSLGVCFILLIVFKYINKKKKKKYSEELLSSKKIKL